MDTVTITILIAIVGCLVGLANWVRNMRNDSDQLVSYITRLEAQINHLEQQVVDLKTDIRQTQKQIQAVVEDATTARNTANALHDRLDSLGVKSASQARK